MSAIEKQLPGTPAAGETTDLVRQRALRRLKKRRDLAGHAIVYVLVNAFIVVIWALTSGGGFFWPIFPMAGWGIRLIMNAWDVWHGDEFTEAEIAREMARIAADRDRIPR